MTKNDWYKSLQNTYINNGICDRNFRSKYVAADDEFIVIGLARPPEKSKALTVRYCRGFHFVCVLYIIK